MTMEDIEQLLENEMAAAIKSYEGDENEDGMMEMIRGLQYSAFRKGVDVGQAAGAASSNKLALRVGSTTVTELLTSLLSSGSADISLYVE